MHPYLKRYNPQLVGVYLSPADYGTAQESFLPQPALYRLGAEPENSAPK
jgi:hypothetical protein